MSILDKLLKRPAPDPRPEQAYFLRPVYPTEATETAARSYLGGTPQLPAGMAWPKSRAGRPMTFLAQVAALDLQTVGAERRPLSAGSVLFFFLNLSKDGGSSAGTPESAVLAAPQSQLTRSTSAPPDLASIVGVFESGSVWRQDTFKARAPRTFPQVRLAISAVSTALNASQLRDEARALKNFEASLAESKRQGYTKDVIQAMRAEGESDILYKTRRAALVNAAERHFPPVEKGLFGARLIGVPWIHDPYRNAESEKRYFDLDQGFPWTWRFVEYIAMGTIAELSEDYRRAKLPLWCGDVELGAEQWLARAQKNDSRSPLTSELLAGFRDWMRRLFEAGATRTDESGAEQTDAEKMEKLKLRITYHNTAKSVLIHALMNAMREILATEAFRTLPPGFVALMEEAMTSCDASGCHQMFGVGRNVQSASITHDDKVMLLQLVSDKRPGWMWGDMGALQFWISARDLMKQDFTAVTTTLEGH